MVIMLILGILSAIAIPIYTGMPARARDAQRATDMRTVRTLVLAYDAERGALPRPTVYGENNGGGYDTSSAGGWVTFLEAVPGGNRVPRDPINNETGDPTADSGGYAYFYYCYHPPWDAYAPDPTRDVARFGYRTEATRTLIYDDIPVTSCRG
ncbi:MAG: type II secretion system GspH family protein [Actinomycetota bacterium]|nr:type II secretion system GspH family protein [Actinomycetota bacterium]